MNADENVLTALAVMHRLLAQDSMQGGGPAFAAHAALLATTIAMAFLGGLCH